MSPPGCEEKELALWFNHHQLQKLTLIEMGTIILNSNQVNPVPEEEKGVRIFNMAFSGMREGPWVQTMRFRMLLISHGFTGKF